LWVGTIQWSVDCKRTGRAMLFGTICNNLGHVLPVA
jgi:hypothetical protein